MACAGKSRAERGVQHLAPGVQLWLHMHAELQGPCSEQSSRFFATSPMTLLHIWTKQCDVQHSTMTLSLRENQIPP